MNQAIAVREQQYLTVKDIKTQVQLAARVLNEIMLKDTHYGVIPGTQKPTLYKAGAEKILSAFRVSVCPVIDDLSTDDEIRYRVHAEGRDSTGALIGTGIGECSTSEEKYKWRKAVCKEEFEATDENRKRVKYAKGRGGTHYTVDQVRTVPADLANTVLKMAKKRAMIDLTLTATACSDVFEQDLEDLPEGTVEERGEQGGKPDVQQPEEQGGGESFGLDGQCISEGQKNMVITKLGEAGLLEADLCKFLKVKTLADIQQKDLTDVVRAIKEGKV